MKRKISFILIICLIFNQSIFCYADGNISIDGLIAPTENKNYADFSSYSELNDEENTENVEDVENVENAENAENAEEYYDEEPEDDSYDVVDESSSSEATVDVSSDEPEAEIDDEIGDLVADSTISELPFEDSFIETSSSSDINLDDIDTCDEKVSTDSDLVLLLDSIYTATPNDILATDSEPIENVEISDATPSLVDISSASDALLNMSTYSDILEFIPPATIYNLMDPLFTVKGDVKGYITHNALLDSGLNSTTITPDWSDGLADLLKNKVSDLMQISSITRIVFSRKSSNYNYKLGNGEYTQKGQMVNPIKLKQIGDVNLLFEPTDESHGTLYFELDDMWENHFSHNIIRSITLSQDCTGMFKNLTALQSIDVYDNILSLPPRISAADSMFEECYDLIKINIHSGGTVNVDASDYLVDSGCVNMFKQASHIGNKNFSSEALNFVSKLKIKAKYLKGMFEECYLHNDYLYAFLKSIDFSKVVDLSYMFKRASFLDDPKFTSQYINDISNVENMEHMFEDADFIMTSTTDAHVIPFSGLKANKLKNITAMFKGVKEIRSYDLSFAKNAKISSISNLFNGCKYLMFLSNDTLDLCLDGCTDLSNLFSGTNIQKIKFGERFNTEKVTTMKNMFDNCPELKNVDMTNLSNKSIANISELSGMFNNCPNLETVTVSKNFTNSMGITYTAKTFVNDTALKGQFGTKVLDVGDASTNAHVDYKILDPGLFTLKNNDPNFYFDKNWCANLVDSKEAFKEIRVVNKVSDIPSDVDNAFLIGTYSNLLCYYKTPSGLNDTILYILAQSEYAPVIHVDKDASGLFEGFTNLERIIGFSYFDFSAVTDASYMFSSCEKFIFDDSSFVFNIKFDNLKNASHMFQACKNLHKLDFKNAEVMNFVDSSYMFNGCASLSSLINIENKKLITLNANNMFCGCTELLDFPDSFEIDLRNCIDTSYMFHGCAKITKLNTTKFNLNVATNVSGMFAECTNLESLNLNELYIKTASRSDMMFMDCKKLVFTGSFSKWNTTTVTDMGHMFEGLESAVSFDGLSAFNTDLCEDLSYMFASCKKIEELDLSSFNTRSVKKFDNMFYNSASLSFIFAIHDFDLSSMESDVNMFLNCRSIKGCAGTVYDNMFTNSLYARIDQGGARKGYFFTYSISEDWFNNFNANKITSGTITKNDVKKIVFADRDTIINDYSNRGVIDECGFLEAVYDNQTMYIIRENYDFPLIINASKYKIFDKFYNLERIENFQHVLTSGLTSMNCFFQDLKNLTYVDLSCIDTSNVSDMGLMFYGCNKLKSINLDNFNTSNVQNMSEMFYDCWNLRNLDLHSFDTTIVSDMSDMFINFAQEVPDSELTPLVLSSFNTQNVTRMDGMFHLARATSIDVSSFDTTNVVDMGSMFTKCNVEILDLSSFNTKKVEYFRYMFEDCTNLNTIYASSEFVTTRAVSATSHKDMFKNCTSLIGGKGTTYDAAHTDKEYARIDDSQPGYFTSKYNTNGKYYFNNNFLNLTTIYPNDVKKIIFVRKPNAEPTPGAWGTMSEIKDSGGLIIYLQEDNGKYIARIYADSETSKIYTTGQKLFYNFSSLESIENLTYLDTSEANNFDYMFHECNKLRELDLSNFSFANVTSATFMFNLCTSLQSIKFGTDALINSSKLSNMKYMFRKCASLSVVENFNNFNTQSVNDMDGLFYDCKSLKSLDFSQFDTTNLVRLDGAFWGCNDLANINFKNFTTDNVRKFQYMFSECYSLKELDLSSFKTLNARELRYMFKDCRSLEKLHIENFDMDDRRANIPNDYSLGMFNGCTNLKTIYCNSNFKRIWNQTVIFDGDTNLTGMSGTKMLVPGYDMAKIDRGIYRPGYFTTDAYDVVTFELFNLSSTSVPDQIVPVFENVIKPTIVPLSDHYVFDYWYLDDENVPYNFDTAYINDDITLYSHWSPKSNNIIYELNGGYFESGYTTKDKIYIHENLVLATEAYVKRNNYTFAGWYKDPSFTGERVYAVDGNVEGDIRLYAKWEGVRYNIRYHYIDGAYVYGELKESAQFDENVVLIATDSVLKDGSHMIAWYNNPDLIGTATTSIPANHFTDVDLYAKWYDDNYGITYKNLLDSTWAPGFVATTSRFYHEQVILPTKENISRIGYEFDGWYDDEFYNGSPITEIPANSNPNEIILFAKWKENEYKIIFNGLPNETNIDFSIFKEKRLYTERATLPTADYVVSFTDEFLGWYNNKDLLGDPVTYIPANIATDSVVWGKFKPRIYNITYDLAGGSFVSGFTYKSTRSYAEPIESLPDRKYVKKQGYKFLGWYDSLGIEMTSILAYTAGDALIIAKWQEITYTVSYHTNGGAWVPGFIATTSRLYHEGFTLPTSSNIVRIGYDFGGWWIDAACTASNITEIVASTSESHTLYAKWTLDSNYVEVTFDSMGGSYIYPQAVIRNTGYVSRPINPTKNGYSFVNWYRESMFSNVFDFNTATLSESITLYAKWQKNNTPPPPHGGGGGSGGGGGGRGGINYTNSLYTQEPKKDNVTLVLNRNLEANLNNVTCNWIYIPQIGKWQLSYGLDESKTMVKSMFANVKGKTYYFDENGYLVTGWLKDIAGDYYLLEWQRTVDEGSMIYGWRIVGGIWYYFMPDGKMLTSNLTPDGFMVNEKGEYF